MKNKIISILLIILFSTIFIYGMYNIIFSYVNVKENNTIKEEISEKIVDVKEEDIINSLQEINKDVIGYLIVNNTSIDYPVVKGNDNDYYLNHNMYKKKNSAGWIFADYKNKIDGTDKNIVIYGHNMLNGSMFGTLKRTLKKEWYNNEDNLKIKFIVNNEVKYYEVFSIYIVKNEEYYIKTNFNSDEEYVKFLNTIKKRSHHKFDVELNTLDNIITLSTCSGNGVNRMVLHAKEIK